MWLACRTQDEISEATGIAQQTIDDWIKDFTDFSKLAESAKATASHAVDFDPPIYNIWKQQQWVRLVRKGVHRLGTAMGAQRPAATCKT